MSSQFDQVNNRRNTNSMKWDVASDELPLWVADMDFKTAPSVIEALEKKVATGIFGYTIIPDEWYDSIQNWWQIRHHHRIEKDWLVFSTGVVAALSTAVKRLTNVGDQVVIQTPVYNIFFNSIVNHGRHVVENPLKYEENQYQIDFEDLEEKLSHPLTTLMILCNPHNPVGKIWRLEELEKIGDLCKKHNVTVVSDEIHCDLTDVGKSYTPFAKVSPICAEISISCCSASKAFNLAGLQSAFIVAPNKSLRDKMTRGLNSDEVAEPNAFAVETTIAAFTKGADWVDDLRSYITDNKQYVNRYLLDELPDIKLVESEATYLLWLDVSAICSNSSDLQSFIRQETGLYLSEGAQFGGNGYHFLRLNVACPRKTLNEAMARLKSGITAYCKLL